MTLNNCTVLFADDEEKICKNMENILSLMTNKVHIANDGKKAYDIFCNKDLDIIILDIDMPYLNGLKVAKKIRETNKEIPIIISTAHCTTEYLLEAIELNLTSYIIKPITIDSLQEALQKALSNLSFYKKQTIYISKCVFYNTHKHTLHTKEKEIILRNIEMQFLEYMLKYPNRVISYEEFERNIWDEGMSGPAIRSLVRDLRKYLPTDTIQNISKVGYKLVIP